MKFKTIIMGLIALLIAVSTAAAQNINIHTAEGTTSISLAEVDSITFSGEGEGKGPEPGEEREFRLIDEVTITMCWIPAGEFEMGSPDDEFRHQDNEEPVHTVTFESGFWMGKYEVTQRQWEAVTGRNPGRYVGENHPVERVSWDSIREDFIGVIDDFRFPSEAEWEYGCRAGTGTSYYWGDGRELEDIDDYAIYGANHPDSTAVVGTKLPNAWGLYDMSGNVREFCEDWYHNNYEGAPRDGRAWVGGGSPNRIVRGGGIDAGYQMLRSASRGGVRANYSSYAYGFRLVRDAD